MNKFYVHSLKYAHVKIIQTFLSCDVKPTINTYVISISSKNVNNNLEIRLSASQKCQSQLVNMTLRR